MPHNIRVTGEVPTFVTKPWDENTKKELFMFLKKLADANNSSQITLAALDPIRHGKGTNSGLHQFLLCGA